MNVNEHRAGPQQIIYLCQQAKSSFAVLQCTERSIVLSSTTIYRLQYTCVEYVIHWFAKIQPNPCSWYWSITLQQEVMYRKIVLMTTITHAGAHETGPCPPVRVMKLTTANQIKDAFKVLPLGLCRSHVSSPSRVPVRLFFHVYKEADVMNTTLSTVP